MERTPVQKQIENTVTNGIGYINLSSNILRRLNDALAQKGIIQDTELDLQIHLGILDVNTLDATTPVGRVLRMALLEQVLSLGTIKKNFAQFGMSVPYKTAEEVDNGLYMQECFKRLDFISPKEERKQDKSYIINELFPERKNYESIKIFPPEKKEFNYSFGPKRH